MSGGSKFEQAMARITHSMVIERAVKTGKLAQNLIETAISQTVETARLFDSLGNSEYAQLANLRAGRLSTNERRIAAPSTSGRQD
ncbi:MAG: hypothetical protein HC850_12600 [Rhodomicrobium sp.]|nr:hypothetical protein [Rhodomicrobium sp.]